MSTLKLTVLLLVYLTAKSLRRNMALPIRITLSKKMNINLLFGEHHNSVSKTNSFDFYKNAEIREITFYFLWFFNAIRVKTKDGSQSQHCPSDGAADEGI